LEQYYQETAVQQAERVEGLVEALEYAASYTHQDVTVFMMNHKDLGQWEFRDELIKRIRDRAKEALAKYRGEVGE
jgi:5'-deoxynucleotidase YfbR-like HD superfamily hydrolase